MNIVIEYVESSGMYEVCQDNEFVDVYEIFDDAFSRVTRIAPLAGKVEGINLSKLEQGLVNEWNAANNADIPVIGGEGKRPQYTGTPDSRLMRRDDNPNWLYEARTVQGRGGM